MAVTKQNVGLRAVSPIRPVTQRLRSPIGLKPKGPSPVRPPVGPGPVSPIQPFDPAGLDPTRMMEFLLQGQNQPGRFSMFAGPLVRDPISGEMVPQGGEIPGELNFNRLDIARFMEERAQGQQSRESGTRQAQADEERSKIERERLSLDKEENRFRRDTDLAIEQGRFRDALATRRNEMNIQRLRSQLDLREQNMNLMNTLLSNPLLFPAVMSQGGIGSLLGTLPGISDDFGAEESVTSLRGQQLPFNPNILGGADMSLSEWNRLTPDQQAFFYDQAGSPIGFTSVPGTSVRGTGGAVGGGFDPSMIQEIMRRAFPLASLGAGPDRTTFQAQRR